MSKSTPWLLCPIEAATILGLATSRLMRLARRGEVPCVEFPDGEIRFDRDELLRFIDDRRRPVTEGDQ